MTRSAQVLALVVTGGLIVATPAVAGSIQTDGQLVSTVATGTPPLDVTSQTVVGNLNADLLDGLDGSLFQRKYGGVAVVATSGGDYGDPISAMPDLASWCGTPTAASPCLLEIMPGVYDLGRDPRRELRLLGRHLPVSKEEAMSQIENGGMAARVIAAAALVWVTALVGRAHPEPLATVAWTPGELTFQITGDAELLLIVGGPAFSHWTRGRGSLTFVAEDEDGLPLLDGRYHFELREVVTLPELEDWQAEPNPRKRQAIERRLRREGKWPPPPRVQHGVFRIESGMIVPPVARESTHVDETQSPAEPEAEHDHPHESERGTP